VAWRGVLLLLLLLLLAGAACVRAGYGPDAPRSDRGGSEGAVHDTQAPDLRVLLREGFSAKTSLVPDGFGVWDTANGTLQQTSCLLSVSDAAFPGLDFTDVWVTAQVRVDKTCSGTTNDASLLFRVASFNGCNNRYYACNLDLGTSELQLVVFKGSCAFTIPRIASVPLATNVWYQLEAVARGGDLSCTVSGGPQPATVTWSDPAPIPSGSVGFGVIATQASFDDLVVLRP